MKTGKGSAMRNRMLLLLPAIAVAGGCSFTKLTEGGAKVRPATAAEVGSCTGLGRTTASVLHEVGFIQRSDGAVRDNVYDTAKNSAAGMGGDTIVPASPLADGKQTFDVYRCGRG
jgi:uncharacterized protein DUF4156